MAALANHKSGRWGLKALLLAFIVPVLMGVGVAGIWVNYLIARNRAQQAIDDHIFRRRWDLRYMAAFPVLKDALAVANQSVDIPFSHAIEASATLVDGYLRQSKPPFPYALRVVSFTGKVLLEIRSNEDQTKSSTPLGNIIKPIALIDFKLQDQLPRFLYPPALDARIRDHIPVYGKSEQEIIGAIDWEYGFPVKELMTPVRQTLVFNLIIMAIILMIAVVAVYFIVDKNLKPLKRLSSLLQEMTDGDLSQPVMVEGSVDICVLAGFFESLRKRLNHQIELLKHNAVELAQSLEQAQKATSQFLAERDYSTGILNGTPNLICGIGSDGLLTFINPAAEKISGQAASEVTARPFEQFSLLKGKTGLISDLFKQATPKGLHNLEWNMTTRAGQRRTLLLNSVLRLDEQGRAREIVLIGNDVTEIKEAEEELRRFRTIADSSSYGIAIYDLQGNLTYINEAYAEMHGYRTEDLIGKHQSVFFGARFSSLQQHLQKLLNRRGYLTAEEVMHVRKDGRPFPVLISSILVRNDLGQPQFYSETAIDISEKKALEEQLQIRQRMDSLGTLAGGIAHDFNNLLSGISGYLDLLHLRSDNFTENQKRYLNQLTTSVLRATELIHQFQKLSHGNVSEKHHLDISKIVGEVFSFLQLTTDRTILKQNRIESGRFYVKGNHTELRQVFLNLAVNAKEAIETKGLSRGDYIRAEARNVLISETRDNALRGGRYVHITIADSGCGMSEVVKARAFDPLFSSKKMGKRKGQGLGLAMVYNIIKNHNGHVTLDSTPGSGTTLHVYLPAAAPTEQHLQDGTGLMSVRETILLVDGEKNHRDAIKEELEQLGYTLIIASDGHEAWQIFQVHAKEIDLVILDLMVPKMPAMSVLKKMVEFDPQVKVIALSNQHSETESEEIRLLVKKYLTRPILIKDLSDAMRMILDAIQ